MMPTSPFRPGNAVAIVGMACRLPGGLNSPEELWEALLAERDLITEVPPQRWDVDAVFDPKPGVLGRTVSRWGGFLGDVAGFDAEFFGIAPREAVWMDPQQRLLLEVGYEALEDAGVPLEQVAGSDCGVYIGQAGSDYWTMTAGDTRRFRYHGMTGACARSVMSGRLSFAFDLRGPALSIDTACSSGLAAVDVAVRYLRSGGRMALAGGVNMMLIPDQTIVYSGAMMLSPTGRCRFADADADGFVRSEAVGVLVLKPLEAALDDGDRIRAVLLGSANGSDGRDGGLLTRPGPEGQRRVLENACRDAGVDPADIDFVEAHGPGTRAGDPVEVETLGVALGAGRPADRPLMVTSVKTNLGHTESAAGIIGVIKAVLCLEHRLLPASLHLNRLSPDIPWDRLPLRIVRAATAIPDSGRPVFAGVNSFGISGNNAHVVLCGAPADATGRVAGTAGGGEGGQSQVLTLSAAGPEALREMAARWAEFLDRTAGSFTDVCHSAAVRRTHHPFRLATVADSAGEAAQSLRDFLAGSAPLTVVGEAGRRPQVAFVFPGQGSQWAAMGRDLLSGEAVYAAAFDECDTAIRAETGVSVRGLIEEGSEDWLARTDVVQPVLWATQVALAALWRSWGVEPDAVIGHSMGEVAAACVAGALSIPDGAAVICRRSALAARLHGRGAMAWTELTATQAEQAVAGRDVVVAAYNGPDTTVLSGDAASVAELVAELEARGTAARLVNVDYASHCPQIDEISQDLLDALADLSPRAGGVPIRSTLLGRITDGSDLDARYWARNIREPVDFTGAVHAQLAAADTVFIEVSAHPVLTTAVRAHGGAVRAFGSLRRHASERVTLLQSLAELHVTGVPVDWSSVVPAGRYVPLPRYPWQHQDYWLPPAEEAAHPPRHVHAAPAQDVEAGPAAAHPLLGAAEPAEADGTRRWTGRLDLDVNGYLLDHRVQDAAILPGTGYVEMMATAAREIFGPVPVVLAEISFLRALFLDAADRLELRVTARPDGPAWRFTVHSRLFGEATWVQHVEAAGRPAAPSRTGNGAGAGTSGGLAGPLDTRARCTARQTGAQFYAYHAARGNQWNGAFQAVVEVWRGEGEAVARVRLPDPAVGHQGDLFHPALLDGCAQAILAARPEVVEGADAAFVLGGIGAYRLYRVPGPELWSHAWLLPDQPAGFGAGSLRIFDNEGLVAEVDEMRLRYLMGRAPAPAPHTDPTIPGIQSTQSPMPISDQDTPPRPPSAGTTAHEGSAHEGSSHPSTAGRAALPEGHPNGRAARGEQIGRDAMTGPNAESDAELAVPAGASAWLYRQEWIAVERRDPEVSKPRRWLVFQDSGPIGRGVVALLRGRGDDVATVTVAAAYGQLDRHRYQVDPRQAEDLAAVVSAVCRGDRLTGVVYLWSLDATRFVEPTRRELERAVHLGCTGVAHLARALDQACPARPPRLWLVTRGSQRVLDRDGVTGLCQAPVWGLGPALAGERPSLHTTLVDLDEHTQTADPLVQELLGADEEDRVALRGEDRFVARLRWDSSPLAASAGPRRLTQPRTGVLDGLGFTADAPPGTPGPGQVLIRAEYAALNFRDVLCATGAYPGQDGSSDFGYECAGTVAAVGPGVNHLAVGDRVVALTERALATHVLASAELAVRLPAGLDPAHAVTMPMAFITAYQALHVLGRVGPGDRVLVHSASGGVGLAAVQVARWRGARVYGTCGPGKREAIASLPLDGIADSRSLEFVEQFRRATAGRGFDIIVNTLVDDAVAANLSLLAPGGRYIELAKRHIVAGTAIGMDVFARNRSFHGLDIIDLIRSDPPLLGQTLRAVFAGYERGDFQPLRFREFGPAEVGDAFRHMARAQHVGKLIVALPRTVVAARTADAGVTAPGTHLLAGGLGGIGGSLARHLVRRGVRDLVLLGRSPLSPEPGGSGPRLLQELRELGARVDYHALDVADTAALTAVLATRRAAGAPPIRAVYHLAGVFDQGAVADLDPARLAAIVHPKIGGGWALHHAVSTEPVQRFVFFSSGSSVLSSPTGGAYAAGNAFLDALARHRRARGLPATLLNWGYWAEVGMVARETMAGHDMTPRGMRTFTPDEALRLFDALVDNDAAEAVILRVDWPVWSAVYPTAGQVPFLGNVAGRDAASPVIVAAPGQRSATESAPAPQAPPPLAPPAPPPAGGSVPDAVADVLAAQVAQVLGLRADRIRQDRALTELGIDSLMAVELRNLIEHEFDVSVQIVDILRGVSVRRLARLVQESGAGRTEGQQ